MQYTLASQCLAEFIGTCILILLGNGVVAGCLLKKSKGENAGWVVITLGWGLAVLVAVLSSSKISGAHLNPAVSLALVVAGKFSSENLLPYMASQMAGGAMGATLVFLFYGPHWRATTDPDLKLAAFCTAPAIRHTASNLFCEFLATMVLVFIILCIGANEISPGLGPYLVGMLIVSLGVSLGGTTGYAMSPARDLAPRIMHFLLPIPGKRDSDWGYAWIPVVGSMAGGVAAAWLFKAVY